MIVARGMGTPGGLVVSFGLGRGTAVAAVFHDIIRLSVQLRKFLLRTVKIDKKVSRTVEH